MKVKEVDRTAHVAWSPATQFPILLATGTAAQQLDATFSTSSSLEIYGLNLLEPGLDMVCKGSVAIDNRFHTLCWGGTASSDSAQEVCGTIVGGCDGGKMFVYNPNKIISGDSDALVFQSEKHTGPVRALDFNPFQANLLASGASDSEIYIWDLVNLSSPMTPGAKSQPTDDVTSIAWNCQVQHILASTFATRCVVWDLRKNEPIIKVSSSTSRMSCKVVSWHPEVATQMCLASEDDNTPFIQLWDLRFAASPLKTMDNKQRGILSLAWCAQDPDLLLSGGKDHRIVCWNPNSSLPGGEVVCEIPTSNQWSFDVAWCPRNPGLISSCSFDGHVSIFSLMGEQQQVRPSSKVAEAFLGVGSNFQVPEVPQSSNDSKVILKHPPKWLKRPISVSFGFGGKLVTFDVPSKADGVPNRVYISQVTTEPEMCRQAKHLEEVLTDGNFAEFCAAKVGLSSSPFEAQIWSFIQAKFDVDPKSKYLELLNHPVTAPTEESNSFSRTDSPEEAFDHISRGVADDVGEGADFTIPTDEGITGQVSLNLLSGKLEEAMELCLMNDLSSEALLLGIAGGEKLLARAQQAYFKKNSSNPLIRLISVILQKDWDRLVNTCTLECWKEALAVCLVYADPRSIFSLSEKLGNRLSAQVDNKDVLDATLCYIMAGRIDKVVDCWWKSPVDHSQSVALQNLAEQVLILKQLPGQNDSVGNESSVVRCLNEYAHYIASQGNLSTALMFARASPRNQEDISILTQRLEKALRVCETRPLHLGSNNQPQQLSTNRAVTPGYGSQPWNRKDSTGSVKENVQRPSGKGGPMMNRYLPIQPASNAYNSSQPASNAYNSSQPASNAYNPSQPASNISNLSQPASNISNLSQPASFFQPSLQPQGYFQPSDPHANNFSFNNPHPLPGMYTPFTTNAPPPDVPFYEPPPLPPSQITAANIPPMNYSPRLDPNHESAPDVPHYPVQDCKPGWNDPPSMVQSQVIHKPDYGAPLAPITNPIYPGEAPTMQRMPNIHEQHMAPNYEGYHSSQQFQPQPPQQTHKPVVHTAQEVKPKPVEPIPAEHVILKDVFDDLKNNCSTYITNMQIKRKLEDVSKKLEVLYNKLRENSLSASTIFSLNQMIQYIQQHDYNSALMVHSQMVGSIAFSEISGFMPGLKALIQIAMQANVYLR